MDLAITSLESLAVVGDTLSGAVVAGVGIWRIAMSILMTLALAAFAWYQCLIETRQSRERSRSIADMPDHRFWTDSTDRLEAS